MAGTRIEAHPPMHAHTQRQNEWYKAGLQWQLASAGLRVSSWLLECIISLCLLLPAYLHLCASTAACDKHRVMSAVLISQWWGDNEIWSMSKSTNQKCQLSVALHHYTKTHKQADSLHILSFKKQFKQNKIYVCNNCIVK